jgi:truncated hemoglobin YjbI
MMVTWHSEASRYAHCDAAGVTEPIIRRVVVAFYERVKRDATFGPVFRDIVGDD